MICKKKIDAEIEKVENERLAIMKRRRAIFNGVCPDCAGRLNETTSLWAKLFAVKTKYYCESCNKTHEIYFWD